MRAPLRPAGLLFSIVSSFAAVHAQETIYFTNGFSLLADSHTQTGDRIVLRANGGTLEFPASQIEKIKPGEPTNHPAAPKDNSGANFRDLVTAAAGDQQLPPEFLRSVAQTESGFREGAISPKGAIGLMQLMPSTAAELGVDPARADQNAEGGAKYLRELLIRYHGDSALALAAYNAGPAAVDKFGGVPPYPETRRYVLRVLREYERERAANSSTSKTTSATN